jgi:DNA-binding NtrC family response regulator
METTGSIHALVVDDEEALLETYEAMLSIDYEVETAASGSAALAKLSSETDVVLLDRRMPEQSGEAILSEIRDRGVDCQVVFCSAVVPDTDIVPLEIDDYLQKPVSPDDLSETIEQQADVQSQSDEIREYAALVAKRAAIEDAAAPTSGDEQYQTLLEEIEQKEQTADSTEIELAQA